MLKNLVRIFAGLSLVGVMFFSGLTTFVVQAKEADDTRHTLTCAYGIDGLVQFSINPVPDDEVQLFEKEAGFIIKFDHGNVTLPVDNLDGATTLEAWGVIAHRPLAEVSLSSCSQPTTVDVYVEPGEHFVNGREWRTACEPYSQTERCRTEIYATQVTQVNGMFVSKKGWVFNNLTYKAAPRSLYKGNPIGYLTGWTSADGRQWNTDCDSAETGRNGCRSYILAQVIVADTPRPGEAWTYRWEKRWVFNNMVRFS